MNNANLLVTGQPGAGKTTLARWLAVQAWRVLILDPVEDYTPATLRGFVGSVLTVEGDPRAAVRTLVETRDEPAAVIYRPASDTDPAPEYDLVLRGAELVQRSIDAAPLAVVVDEASLAGETYAMLPALHRLFNVGRRWRVSILTIIQDATDIHRISRRNARAILALQQIEVATALARKFDVQQLARLQALHPGVVPRLGVHFLAYPPGLDVAALWRAVTNPEPDR